MQSKAMIADFLVKSKILAEAITMPAEITARSHLLHYQMI
jgi:hypothetical protein